MKKTENIFQERKIAKIEKEETDCRHRKTLLPLKEILLRFSKISECNLEFHFPIFQAAWICTSQHAQLG